MSTLIAGRCEHEENWSKFLNARKAVTTDYLTDEETIPALFSKFGRSAEQRMKTNFCETVERIMGIRAIGLDQTPKGTIWPQEQFPGAKFETDEKVSFSLQQGLTCLGSQQGDRKCKDYLVQVCCATRSQSRVSIFF